MQGHPHWVALEMTELGPTKGLHPSVKTDRPQRQPLPETTEHHQKTSFQPGARPKVARNCPETKKILTADRLPTPQGELDPLLGSPAPWQDATCPSEMTVQAQGQPLLSTSSFSRLPAKSTCPTCCQHEHNLLLQMEHRPRHTTQVLPGCSFRLSSSLASFTTSMTKTFNLSFALLPSGQAFQQKHLPLSIQPSL